VFEYFTTCSVEMDAANFVMAICGQLYYVHTTLCSSVYLTVHIYMYIYIYIHT
jgi:hypothetical protein